MNKRLVGAFAAAALSVALVACGGDDDDSDSTGGSGATSSGGSTPAALKLDTAFGTGGISALPLNPNGHDRFLAVAQSSDGKTYAAGFTVTGEGDQAMAVARIDSSGKLDTSFGTGGIASVNVAVGGKAGELARAVAVQSDGKIVISGPFEKDPAGAGDAARDIDVAAARFDTSGKLDASFGTGGVAKVDFGTGRITTGTTYIADTAWGMAIGQNGRIIVMGSTPASGDGRVDTDFVFGSFTSAGQIDTAFGQGGKVVIDVATASNNPRTVLVQPDGKIVGTGYSSINGVVQPQLIRLTAAGQPDTTFGTNGVAAAQILPGVAESYGVSMQGDKYILAGYGRGADTNEKVDMIVYRFDATGKWDETFGTAGGMTRIDIAKEDDRSRNILVLPDGRILAVGSGKKDAVNIDAMAALFDKDGKPITDFGVNGQIISDLGGPADAWFGVTLSSDKKSVLLAGYKGTDQTSGGSDDAVIARIVF
jgi:uncharacterized delta-60 repeat protein